jgi:sulfur-carrier protein
MSEPASPAALRILYFAWLRERVGVAEEEVAVPPEVRDVAGLIAWLRGRSAGHAAAFSVERSVRCAVNQDFAAPDAPVRAGDEVAFFPPVTGG